MTPPANFLLYVLGKNPSSWARSSKRFEVMELETIYGDGHRDGCRGVFWSIGLMSCVVPKVRRLSAGAGLVFQLLTDGLGKSFQQKGFLNIGAGSQLLGLTHPVSLSKTACDDGFLAGIKRTDGTIGV